MKSNPTYFKGSLPTASVLACAVFLGNQGIDLARLTAAGLGEGFPVASNDTEAGRTQNRRVEMYVRN